ncbi:N-acetylglutamate synthase [Sulfitobacter sp. THAF37]|uniref:GNAT family N-acetyltransferase n=1 Tax=Sulfitobacter sp. THAF37 TaxID=2587855 RepID=UPI00126854B2|nr:GNAT family N-acetyltransferase [Sulfitobacter sp. THAF37]QFT59752.1 N-acetylglutamate synthase [Sulfitobacter sp. THAF37]
MPDPSLALHPVDSAPDLDAVRALCWGYRDYLLNYGPNERVITETFYPEDQYAHLMDRLAEEHARPTGFILLARKDGEPVGCGMSHPLGGDATEIKRVFVTEAARGTGAGRAICAALIDQARADGFRRVLLDTSRNFAPARALYLSLGFVERGPYQHIPQFARDKICYFELTL